MNRARGVLKELCREACTLAPHGFLRSFCDHQKLVYSAVLVDYDGVPYGAYPSKFAALSDPAPEYDVLRETLFLPRIDAAAAIGNDLIHLAGRWEGDGDVSIFDRIGSFLFVFDEQTKHAAIEPCGYTDDVFDTYLAALATEGHEYYMSVWELLAVAEATHTNVIVTELLDNTYDIIGKYLGGHGNVAVVVPRGDGIDRQRGHFERLCALDVYEEAENVRALREVEAAAVRQRASDERERLQQWGGHKRQSASNQSGGVWRRQRHRAGVLAQRKGHA